MRRMVPLLAGAFAAGSLLAACGGDGGGSSANVSKADYIESADERCREAAAELEAIPIPESETDENIEAYAGEAVEIYRDMIGDLRDLDRPEADADTIESLYDDFEEVVDALDEDAVTFLQSSDDPFGEVNERAQDFGFEVCGSG